MKVRKLNYKGTKIIIENTNYNFSYFVTKYKGNLIISFGTQCNYKSKILHRAIKKTRNNLS
ncbi:hypothetical protein EXN57_02510 [Clostridium botulinum]|nr:hypothetical protein [Clostridium botulinum]NFD32773.1 hypothetical protein [Clostridium botulinum]NFD58425.1 hypothetical protein [Clostridium botulinum]NFE00215.1 hypothetical protein [Clostridium botulinum]